MNNEYNFERGRQEARDWEMVIRRDIETQCRRETPDRLRVLEIAHHDPIVAALVDAWRYGHLTWEQALCQAVIGLADFRRRYNEERLDFLQAMPKPITIQPPSPPTEGS